MCLEIRFLNDDGVGRGGRFQRDRIAATRCAYGLRIDVRGAILADKAAPVFLEPLGTANGTGVEDGSDIAIGLFVQPEANVGTVFFGDEAVQVTVGNRTQGYRGYAVGEGKCGSRGFLNVP